MSRVEELLVQFSEIASNPRKQLDKYLGEGKKAIGVFPYYAPEEIIAAADMVPFGLWGCSGTPKLAKEYFASFYCSIAQMGLEMLLNGTLDGVSGILCTTLCDTLRPLTQNLKVACGKKEMPFIFLTHPQNRKPEYGVKFTMAQYEKIRAQVEEISGNKVTDEDLQAAIKMYNANRKACRKFVELAGAHPETVSAVSRSAVLKSRYFMVKSEHTELLEALNAELEKLPAVEWEGTKVVTSGIAMDNANLLKLFDEHKIAIVADDVAQESRAIRKDAAETGDPMRALAVQFGEQDQDTILYDPAINSRPAYLVNKVKENDAQGLVIMMMQFCDPEELEFPDVKKAMEEASIPYVKLGYDHQMTDFGQANTSLQAFADVLEMRK